MPLRKLHAPVEPDQSAVIPYRIRKGQPEVLLVTSRGKGRWIIPKGSLEEDLDAHESAAKEALEEAGVKGQVSPVSLGCYRHGRSKKAPIVEVFLMRVERELKSWPEQDERQRRWILLEDAYGYVREAGLRSILDEAVALIRLARNDAPGDPDAVPHPARPEPETSTRVDE